MSDSDSTLSPPISSDPPYIDETRVKKRGRVVKRALVNNDNGDSLMSSPSGSESDYVVENNQRITRANFNGRRSRSGVGSSSSSSVLTTRPRRNQPRYDIVENNKARRGKGGSSSHESDGETDDTPNSLSSIEDDEPVNTTVEEPSQPIYNVLAPRINSVLAHKTVRNHCKDSLEWPEDESTLEYLVSWCGRSLLWASWVSYKDVIDHEISGSKKIENYRKTHRGINSRITTFDDRERLHVEVEQYLAALTTNCQCDRILIHDLWKMAPWEEELYHMCPVKAMQTWNIDWKGGTNIPDELIQPVSDDESSSSSDNQDPMIRDIILVKWSNMPYAESTWELEDDVLNGILDKTTLCGLLSEGAETLLKKGIEEFLLRENRVKGVLSQKNPLNRHSLCDSDFTPYEENPEFLNVPKDLSGVELRLRDYQLTGINWMINNMKKGNSLLLADEMGLGKTVQVISTAGHILFKENVGRPILVIVPQTTIDNWGNEFRKWLPQANVILFHGNGDSRRLIHTYELNIIESMDKSTEAFESEIPLKTYQTKPFGNFKIPPHLNKKSDRLRFQFDVVVATPSLFTCVEDFAYFQSIPWYLVIIDEAHQLKNHKSLRYKAVQDIPTQYRIFLTGTPLHNNLKELFNLMHLLTPHVPPWDDRDAFEKKYALIEDSTVSSSKKEALINGITKQLARVMLRRVKRDVLGDVAPKEERILRVELSPEQKEMYQSILLGNFQQLVAKKGGAKSSLMNIVMELKKVCNHPFLCYKTVEEKDRMEQLVMSSGKVALLDELLPRLKERGCRVLIFSQMVSMLKLLSEYLSYRRYRHQQLNGTMTKEERKKAMDAFNAVDSEEFCFLLSTRAGGLGINLTSADVVILFDSDWNPQNDLQAEARAHRLGQKKKVKIYRLICKDSVEESVLERARKKLILDSLVVQGMNTGGSAPGNSNDKSLSGLSSNELNKIMRFGANKLFADEGDSREGIGELKKLDLDAILTDADERAEKEAETMTNTSGGEAERLFASFSNISDFTFKAKWESGSSWTESRDKKVGGTIEEDDEWSHLDGDDYWRKVIPEEELSKIKAKEQAEREDFINSPRARRSRVSPTSNSPSRMKIVLKQETRIDKETLHKWVMKVAMNYGGLIYKMGKNDEKRKIRESIWSRAISNSKLNTSLEDCDVALEECLTICRERTRGGSSDARYLTVSCTELFDRVSLFKALHMQVLDTADVVNETVEAVIINNLVTASVTGRKIEISLRFWSSNKKINNFTEFIASNWSELHDAVLLLAVVTEGLGDWKGKASNNKYQEFLQCIDQLSATRIRGRVLRLMKELKEYRKETLLQPKLAPSLTATEDTKKTDKVKRLRRRKDTMTYPTAKYTGGASHPSQKNTSVIKETSTLNIGGDTTVVTPGEGNKSNLRKVRRRRTTTTNTNTDKDKGSAGIGTVGSSRVSNSGRPLIKRRKTDGDKSTTKSSAVTTNTTTTTTTTTVKNNNKTRDEDTTGGGGTTSAVDQIEKNTGAKILKKRRKVRRKRYSASFDDDTVTKNTASIVETLVKTKLVKSNVGDEENTPKAVNLISHDKDSNINIEKNDDKDMKLNTITTNNNNSKSCDESSSGSISPMSEP